MDQDSSKEAGLDKRSWRERLGIGAKEMPRISGEFKPPPSLSPPEAPPARSRPPQPVTRTAPMAPRMAAPKLSQPAPAAAESRRSPSVPPSEALADKLRAQRAAAEKLAEQRVTAARERAEARTAASEGNRAPSRTSGGETTTSSLQLPSARPKFSFADEDPVPPRREAPAPDTWSRLQRPALPSNSLAPPRPALSGDRPQLRAPSSGLRPDGSPGYRPIDPATGYTPPPRPTLGGQRRYTDIHEADYPERVPTRPVVFDSSGRRRVVSQPYPAETYEDEFQNEPRLSRAAAAKARSRIVEEEPDGVFEDEIPAQPPRRRASASDYQSAYREAEDGYEEDRRRSNGPWLLLLALLVAAMATGGIVWYYNTKIKGPATAAATQGTTESVPVVAAPEQPAKTVPAATAEPTEVPVTPNKKQIYDRIVGDQEILGGPLVPTEEKPVLPEVQAPDATGATQLPQPADAATQSGTAGQSGQATEEPLPLPLPPPPGDNNTQGALQQGTDQSVAAAANPQGSSEPAAETTALPATGSSSVVEAAKSQAGELVSEPADATGGPITDSDASTAKPKVTTTQPKPAKKKAASKSVSKKTVSDAAVAPDVEPVPLAPTTGEVIAPSQQAESGTLAPVEDTTQPPPKKKKTIFDLFKGSSDASGSDVPAAGSEQVVNVEPVPDSNATETKVASLPANQPASESAGGSGYVVQLASFRSESEARAEYDRLKFKYPSLVGPLPSRIAQANVAGSTRYRLGLGPVASRDEASKVCNNLFAAGERDCLVRSQ